MTRGFLFPMATPCDPSPSSSSSSSSSLKRTLPQEHEAPSKHARFSSQHHPGDHPLAMVFGNPPSSSSMTSPTLKKMAVGTSSAPYSFSRRSSSSSSMCPSSPPSPSTMDHQPDSELRRIKKARRARPSSSALHLASSSPSQSRKALLAMLLSPIISWYLDHLPAADVLGRGALSTFFAFLNDGAPSNITDELWEQIYPDLCSLNENIARMGPANVRTVGKYLENLAADLSPPPSHF